MLVNLLYWIVQSQLGRNIFRIFSVNLFHRMAHEEDKREKRRQYRMQVELIDVNLNGISSIRFT